MRVESETQINGYDNFMPNPAGVGVHQRTNDPKLEPTSKKAFSDLKHVSTIRQCRHGGGLLRDDLKRRKPLGWGYYDLAESDLRRALPAVDRTRLGHDLASGSVAASPPGTNL